MRIGWKARVNDPEIASYRYRVLGPIAALKTRGHAVAVFDAQRADAYDSIVFSKAYSPADVALASRFRETGRPALLDLCDNHFYNPQGLPDYIEVRKRLLEMIGAVSGVVCSTPALAQIVRAEARLSTLPAVAGDAYEAVDTGPHKEAGGAPQLLWFGLHGSPNAPSGMTDLQRIAGPLENALRAHPFELVVCSNNREKFEKAISPMPVPARYVEWSRDTFPSVLAAARAVILPLSDNPFVACKTHNRLTVALAAGIPVIADPIDSYREFARFSYLGDWRQGLAAVLNEPRTARQRAASSKPYLDAHWSQAAIARQWESALGLPIGPATDASWVGAVGTLRRSASGHLVGSVRHPHRLTEIVEVELIADGESIARTRADLPCRIDEAGTPRVLRTGGFLFPRECILDRPGRAVRYSIQIAGTDEQIAGGVADLPPIDLGHDKRSAA